MKTFTDDLLAKVDHALARFSLANVVIDKMMKFMLPVTTAKACSFYYLCGSYCSQNFCGGDYNNWEVGIFSFSGFGCSIGEIQRCNIACVC